MPRQTGQTLVFGAEPKVRAAAEDLALGQQLHMHFKADDRLVLRRHIASRGSHT